MLITELIAGSFLGMCSVQDIKKKQVPVWMLVCSCTMVLCSFLKLPEILVWERCLGAMMGIILCGISFGTRQAIGFADSVMIVILGVTFGFTTVMIVLLLSLVLSAVAGMFLLGIGEAGRKTKIPYLPFLLAAFMIICWCQR